VSDPRAARGARRGGGDHARGYRAWGYAVGLLLLAAAVALLVRERETVAAALHAVGRPALVPAVALVAAIGTSVVLSALLFSILLEPYGRVGRLEMLAVIAAASLLNLLPLRPGLVGRVAYHRAVNRIAVTSVAKATVQAALIGAACAAWLAACVALGRAAAVPLWIPALAPIAPLAALLAVRGVRRWALALLVRYADALVWAVRYWAAFRLLGLTIDLDAALAFSAMSAIAGMVPFVSGGLGLREWAIGACATIVTPHALAIGVTADLVNRAAELIVLGALGGAGLAYVARRRRHG
jgi:hypothetical protein